MKLAYLISSICITAIFGCMPSNGQVTYLDQRVAQLERQNAAMATDLAQFKKADQELRGQSAGLYAATEEVREEIRYVRGKVEETGHSLEKSRLNASDSTPEKESRLNRVEEVSRQNMERIAKIEQYLNFEVPFDASKRSANLPEKPASPSTSAPSPTSTQTSAAAPPAKKELPETELYESAKLAFDKGESENSREQFLEYLKRFPKSKNANNAQFWIGEIYYRDKWYEKAIMEYQKVIENYPDGNKVPAALLKQGLSFFNLNEKPNARIILQEIVRKYPTSNEAKIAKEKLSTLK
ncbi:MAG: tol-pal system protein YbgF [Pseudomonadota bacterium]